MNSSSIVQQHVLPCLNISVILIFAKMRALFLIFFLSLLVDSNGQQVKPPDVIKVDTPRSVSVKIDPNDSTYLRICLDSINFKISLLNDSLLTDEIRNIDNFISVNKERINRDKIMVAGQPNVNYARFKDLYEILKKYELYRFKLVVENKYP